MYLYYEHIRTKYYGVLNSRVWQLSTTHRRAMYDVLISRARGYYVLVHNIIQLTLSSTYYVVVTLYDVHGTYLYQ